MAGMMADDERYNADEVKDLKLAIGLLTGAWTQQGQARGPIVELG